MSVASDRVRSIRVSLARRLTRARRRLRERGDYQAPRAEDARDRIEAVLAVVRMLFNEGYWSTLDESPIRGELCRLAIGLGRSLHETFPSEPEVMGLLALMVLHEARRAGRLDATGAPVPADDAALAEPHARPMDFTGRPLTGMVYVAPEGLRSGASLAKSIARGVSFASSSSTACSW